MVDKSVIARHNAQIDASLGYDFGYCSPGSIRPPSTNWGDKYRDYWGVCIS